MFRKLFVYIIGDGLAKMLPFLLIPYLTRVLEPHQYGELMLAMAILTMLTIVITFGSNTILVRHFFYYSDFGIPTLSIIALLNSIFLSIVLYVILSFLQVKFLGVIIVSAMLTTLLNSFLAILQAKKYAKYYSIIQLINLTLGLFITIVLFEYFDYKTILARLLSIATALLFSIIICLTFYAKKLFRTFRIKKTLNKIKLYVNYFYSAAAFMFLHQMTFFLRGYVDRFIIESKLGFEELGVYGAASQLAAVVSIGLMIVSKTVNPYINEKLKINKKLICTLRYYAWLYLLGLLVLSPVIIYICKHVGPFILGYGYEKSELYLSGLVLGHAVQGAYLILSVPIIFFGNNKLLSFSTILGTVLHVFLLYFVVNYFSLTFVSWVLLITNLTIVVILFNFMKISDF